MTERRPLRPSDLYRLRLISDPQIAPDAHCIAFVLKVMDEGEDEYHTAIYLVDREGHVRQYSAGTRDWGPRWSPDGRYLAFVSGAKDESQIYVLPTEGGGRVALTHLPLGAGLPIWSPDSSAIAFVAQVSADPETNDSKERETRVVERGSYKLDGAGYIGNRRRHIFVVDIKSREVRQVTDGDHHDDNPSWSPDGRQLVFSSGRTPRWDVSPESSIYRVPRDGGEVERVVAGGAYGRPVFADEGARLFFVGHSDLDQVFSPPRIYSADLKGGDVRDELGSWDGTPGNDVLSDVVLSADEHGVTLIPRPEGIYFLGTARGACNVYRTDGQVRGVTQGARTVTDFSIADTGEMAIASADATHPVEVFLCSHGSCRQLTRENEAFLNEVSITPPERIEFVGARDERSEGWVLRPDIREDETYPLIVYIHGGPHLAHGEALFFEYQLLAARGFGVLFPNIHGSSSYGRDYQVSIRNDWGHLDFQDVLAGTEEAASLPWVDRERIGIAGGSYGGYMTNWAVGHDGRFRAAVTDRCLCNMISFVGTSDLGWMWDRAFGTFPEGDVQKLWDMSPLKYVEAVTAPVLVLHSEGDDRTPLEQGEQMFNALRRLGKETKLVTFPDESHGLSRIGRPGHRVERLEQVLAWFERYL